jgi:hypothetical protein
MGNQVPIIDIKDLEETGRGIFAGTSYDFFYG